MIAKSNTHRNYTLHGHKLRFFQELERAICDREHYNYTILPVLTIPGYQIVKTGNLQVFGCRVMIISHQVPHLPPFMISISGRLPPTGHANNLSGDLPIDL